MRIDMGAGKAARNELLDFGKVTSLTQYAVPLIRDISVSPNSKGIEVRAHC